ncbi:MAG: HAD family phosphatase [Deltaproteobacteria bacterium]|nr:HAD family phosphatase [Deltaproteobacteria bacterium]
MTSVRGVVFDWGGVIIDEPSTALQAYCSKQLGIPTATGSASIGKHLPLYQQGIFSERQLWETVCDECGQSTGVILEHSLWAQALRAVFRFRKEVLAVISRLKANGYKTGFLSNTEPEAAIYFHERQMDQLFDASVLSCEAGLAKPDAAIYQLLIESIQLPPSALLFLDDRQENIDGARHVGMQAVCVDTTDGVLDTLAPLLP